MNHIAQNGTTPLLHASMNNFEKCLSFLLEIGASVNIADANGVTPLMWAACYGNINNVNKLLTAGASVNEMDDRRYTARLYASLNGRSECLRLLDEALAHKAARPPVTNYSTLLQRMSGVKLSGYEGW